MKSILSSIFIIALSGQTTLAALGDIEAKDGITRSYRAECAYDYSLIEVAGDTIRQFEQCTAKSLKKRFNAKISELGAKDCTILSGADGKLQTRTKVNASSSYTETTNFFYLDLAYICPVS